MLYQWVDSEAKIFKETHAAEILEREKEGPICKQLHVSMGCDWN